MACIPQIFKGKIKTPVYSSVITVSERQFSSKRYSKNMVFYATSIEINKSLNGI